MRDAPGYALIHDAAARTWLEFSRPRHTLAAYSAAEIPALLREIETAVTHHNLWAAGFLAYEAAPAFDAALRVRPDGEFPLLWFGLYAGPQPATLPPAPDARPLRDTPWQAAITPDAYARAFAQIKDHISRGETYQVNYTYRLCAPFEANPFDLFLDLSAAQQAAYGGFLHTGDWAICSASPELFLRLDGDHIQSRPMKGTRPRSLTLAEDERQAAALRAAHKDQAENVMIVDMVRNDLGRIARTGSVQVPQLFGVEKYPTVWQMISVVTAVTQSPLSDILCALFPAASIVGAPKPRTMGIIADLETTPRRIYTGALGFIAPGRRAQFNVAIRTALVDLRRARVEYGVGGGIVWDSELALEQAEALAKARILTTRWPAFDLLETLRWAPDEGYFLLEEHLARLADTAVYFDYPFERAAVRQALALRARELPPGHHKVRLLVGRDGRIRIEAAPLTLLDPDVPQVVALARTAVDASNPFLYHKTTNRRIYAAALAERPGFDDVILFNTQGEVTESTIGNVIAEIDGALCTPPVRCGLLAGSYRGWLLARGEVVERPFTVDQLLASPRIFLCNAVRGRYPVTIAA